MEKTAYRPHRSRERVYHGIGHTRRPHAGTRTGSRQERRRHHAQPRQHAPGAKGSSSTEDRRTIPPAATAGEEDDQRHGEAGPQADAIPPTESTTEGTSPGAHGASPSGPREKSFFRTPSPPTGEGSEGTEGTTTAGRPGAKAGSKAKAPSHICNGAIPAGGPSANFLEIRRENTLSAPFCDFRKW